MKIYNFLKPSGIRNCICAAALITASTLLACSTISEPNEGTVIEVQDSEIQIIMEWWDGFYNNNSQILAFKEDGVPIWQKDVEGQKLAGYLPVTSFYKSVDMPEFGENVIYVEERTFGKDGNPYRQRIYTVEYRTDKKTIAVKLWYFKDREKYIGAWNDISKISGLKPEDMSPLPDNCDLYISKIQGRYDMKMPKNECIFGDKLFDYQVSLGSDSFWSRDRIVNSKTSIVESTAGSFGWHKLDKIKP